MKPTSKYWKQPVPTDIRNNPAIDMVSRMLFFEILTSVQNSDYQFVFMHGNKRVSVSLKRGQCFLSINRLSEETNWSRKKIKKSFEILSKGYNEMHIEAKPYGCIITVKNYDKLIKMNNEGNNEGTTKEQRRNNEGASKNKSTKSKKNTKTKRDKTRAEIFIEKFNSLRGTNYRVTKDVKSLLKFHLEDYSFEQILQAVENIPQHDWLSKINYTPDLFLRKTKGWIGACLNLDIKPKKEYVQDGRVKGGDMSVYGKGKVTKLEDIDKLLEGTVFG